MQGEVAMNKVIKLVKCVFSLISGYLLIPVLYLGFILATNSAKGWDVKNADGLLFVPIGIIFLIISLLNVFAYIICLFSAIKNKNRSRYLFVSLNLLGIIFYLLTWCFS